MGYDITIYLSPHNVRHDTGSPQNTRQTQLQRKPTTLLRLTFCFGSLSLPSSCLVPRLAFFCRLSVAHQMNTSCDWPYHQQTSTLSPHNSACYLSAWLCLFRFSVLFLSLHLFPSCYIYGMVSVSRHPLHYLGIDIDTHRKYWNIARYTEKSRYDTEL